MEYLVPILMAWAFIIAGRSYLQALYMELEHYRQVIDSIGGDPDTVFLYAKLDKRFSFWFYVWTGFVIVTLLGTLGVGIYFLT